MECSKRIHSEYRQAMNELRLVCVKTAVKLEETYTSKGYHKIRSLFLSMLTNHYIINNLLESFNAWVMAARFLPASDFIDEIRMLMLKKTNAR